MAATYVPTRDICQELKANYSVGFMMQNRQFRRPLNSRRIAYEEVLDAIMKSQLVEHHIYQKLLNAPFDLAEVQKIVTRMAHQFDLRAVRLVGYILHKVLPRIYPGGIHVLEAEIGRTKAICAGENPVIFLPSHRSYLDFLLISFLCFHLEIPLPAIASATDFLGLGKVGEILRKCGAFFIERAGSVQLESNRELYWAVLKTYVRQLITSCDRPTEFFIEGTRSRTGKSLYPKVGLLSMVLEPLFAGQVRDVTLIPILVHYERFPEEFLYACELLGIPKPKESTSALFKARSILKMNYGSVQVRFLEPISTSEIAKSEAVLGASNRCAGPIWTYKAKPEEFKFCQRLAAQIVHRHWAAAPIETWSILCAAILQTPASPDGFSYFWPLEKLIPRLEILSEMLERQGGFKSPGCWRTQIAALCSGCHSNVLELCGPDKSGISHISLIRPDVVITTLSIFDADTIKTAIPFLMLRIYCNQMLHRLVFPAYIVASLWSQNERPVSDVLADFEFLRNLFDLEFISIPGNLNQDFSYSISLLIEGKIIEESAISVRLLNMDYAKALLGLLRPFRETYKAVYQAAVDLSRTGNLLQKNLESEAVTLLRGAISNTEDPPIYMDVFCLDLIRNACRGVLNGKAASREKVLVTYRRLLELFDSDKDALLLPSAKL